MTARSQIRIMLVDDNEMFRKGLQEVLERSQDFTVVGQTGGGGEALEMAQRLQPDVILLDLLMPVRSGIEVCREITGALPDAKVVMLSVFSDSQASAEAAEAGATGYWTKLWGRSQLLETLRKVAAGSYRPSGLSAVRRRRTSGSSSSDLL